MHFYFIYCSLFRNNATIYFRRIFTFLKNIKILLMAAFIYWCHAN
jgi:hypothetical protein